MVQITQQEQQPRKNKRHRIHVVHCDPAVNEMRWRYGEQRGRHERPPFVVEQPSGNEGDERDVDDADHHGRKPDRPFREMEEPEEWHHDVLDHRVEPDVRANWRHLEVERKQTSVDVVSGARDRVGLQREQHFGGVQVNWRATEVDAIENEDSRSKHTDFRKKRQRGTFCPKGKLMTTSRLSSWALAGLIVCRAALASAQTADDIVEKHLSAMGGRAALAKITSRVTTGT